MTAPSLTPAPPTFGERLRAERHRLGYSAHALALAGEAFGTESPYSRDAVNQWHTRRHGPRVDALAYLSRLGFDLEYLCTGERAWQALRCDVHDGLGFARWPTSLPADVRELWTAQDTAAVAALSRRLRTPSPRELADTFASAMALRVAHAPLDPLPDDAALSERLAQWFHRWCKHFAFSGKREPLPVVAVAAEAARHAARSMCPQPGGTNRRAA